MLTAFLSGNPKGGMLTHGNVIANTAAFIKMTEVNKHTNWTSYTKGYCLMRSTSGLDTLPE